MGEHCPDVGSHRDLRHKCDHREALLTRDRSSGLRMRSLTDKQLKLSLHSGRLRAERTAEEFVSLCGSLKHALFCSLGAEDVSQRPLNKLRVMAASELYCKVGSLISKCLFFLYLSWFLS